MADQKTFFDDAGNEWEIVSPAPVKQQSPAPKAVDYDPNEWEPVKPNIPAVENALVLRSQINPQETRSSGERFKDAVLEASNADSFVGVLNRKLRDWTDQYKEDFRKQFPGRTEDEYEQMSDDAIVYQQKYLLNELRRKQDMDPNWRPDESFWEAAKEGRWVPWFAGQAVGSVGPEMLIAPGASSGARIVAQTGINAAADVGYQGLNMLDGAREEYDPAQTALAGAVGGTMQTAGEIIAKGFKKGADMVRGARGGTTEAPEAAPAPDNPFTPPERPETPRFTPEQEAEYVALLKTGTVDQIQEYVKNAGFSVSRKETEAWVKGRAGNEDRARLIYTDDRRAAGETTPKVANKTLSVPEAQKHIDAITSGWTNKPQFEVVTTPGRVKNARIRKEMMNLPEEERAGVVGLYDPSDGKIRIFANNIESPELLSAFTFHEALGHYALHRQFADNLDNMLVKLYDEGSPNFRAVVDNWRTKNPDAYAPAMDGKPNVARSVDEVLAELSEGGQVPVGLFDPIKNDIKNFLRGKGVKLKYSDREIMAILGMAQRNVVEGTPSKFGSFSKDGIRFMKLWHGTPVDKFNNADEENPYGSFDDAYMSSGEGVQAFSWGHYLAEDRSIAEGRYRDGLSRQKGKQSEIQIGGKDIVSWLYENEPKISTLDTSIPPLPGKDKPGRKAAALAGKPLFKKEPLLSLQEIEQIMQAIDEDNLNYLRDIYNQEIDKKEKQLVDEFIPNLPPEQLKKYFDLFEDIWEKEDVTKGQAASKAAKIVLGKDLENIESQEGSAISSLQQSLKTNKAKRAFIDKIETEGIQRKRPGSTLEVEVPDDAVWLDWDFQPSEKVKNVFKKLGIETKDEAFLKDQLDEIDNKRNEIYLEQGVLLEKNPDILDWMNGNYEVKVDSLALGKYLDLEKQLDSAWRKREDILEQLSPSGQMLYRKLEDKLGSDKAASKALAKEGIAGTKFLDGNSRNADLNTAKFNYVIYDPKTAKITGRFARKRPTRNEQPEPSKTPRFDPEFLASAPDVKAALRDAQNNFGTTFENYPRKEGMTFAEIEEFAAENGLTPAQAARAKLKYTPEQVAQLRDAYDDSRVNMLNLTERVLAGDNSDKTMAEFAKAIAVNGTLQDKIFDLRTQAGRLLNSLKIMDQGENFVGPEAFANLLKGLDNNILNNRDSLIQFAKLLKTHQQAGNNKAVAKLTRGAFTPKAEDYIFSIYYNSMLSSPATHVANTAGTGLNFLNDLIEHGVAAVFGQTRRFSRNADRVMGREVVARIWGALMAMKDINTFTKATQSYMSGVSGNVGPGAKSTNLVFKGPATHLVEWPTRLLAGSDEWFRNVIQLSNIYGLAVRNAGKKNLRGKAFWNEVTNQINNPTKDMLDKSADYTKVMQFLDEPSALGKWVNNIHMVKATDTVPTRLMRGAFRVAIPFVRTPDALIRTAIRRMGPVGLLDRYNLEGLRGTKAEQDIVKGRILIGSILASYIAIQAYNGNVTGEGPLNPQKRKEWEATHQPTSVKVGDEWVSIRGFEPLSAQINTIATLVERMKLNATEDSNKDVLEEAKDITLEFTRALGSNSYTENMVNFMALFDPSSEQTESKIDNFLAGFAANLPPAAALNRQLNQGYGDNAIRDTRGDFDVTDRITGRIASGIPGMSDKLPQRYDVYGRPMTRGDAIGPNFASRMTTKKVETDPVVVELQRLGEKSKSVVIGEGKRTFKVEGFEVELDAPAYQDYIALSGTWTREKMREIMQTDEWKTMDDKQRIELARKTAKDMRKLARETLFGSGADEE